MSENIIGSSQTSSVGRYLKNNLRESGMLLSLVAIMIFFQIVTGGVLMKPLNLTNLVLQNSYIVIMALGMLLIIVTGHIDLSVGSVCGFIGALAAVMMVHWGIPFPIAAILCLLAGGIIGALQGFWVAYFNIPSFIVTLAGMLVFKGLMLAVLGGQSVGPFPVVFQKLSSGFIPEIFGTTAGGVYLTSLIIGVLLAGFMIWQNVKSRQRHIAHEVETEPFGLFVIKNILFFAAIAYLSLLISMHRGLPNVLIIMAVLIAAYAFLTNRTVIGRQIYAVGGNRHAAKLSGVKTERLTFLAFVNMGVLAALAGLVFAARLNTATPKAGIGFELDVIAACFIGGASAYGGVGRVTGAVIGALIMGVMNNGMSILGIGIDYQQVIKGIVLLGAVCIDVYNQKR
ncbi:MULTISPECIES: multiple monosaccharide ABC transporter permease [unclassified Ochrobactrum]|uniref:multiple monosaccharide ABC transporter permease n=1 Tax=unclassified Ochrobactrum TaxID=239106 RepID=UPI0015FC5374|nr:putative multiple sugar transport system permease protein [Ochrobactrum sp. RH2CCR150]MDH7788072.1 putative multiple sugar transport system permease protein [Ochrobactrum sp. 19YEA23]URQ75354.1 MAG: sugar ABC transporter permease [Candidatus Ochrobactrum gambitense]WEK15857.1 MAG: sugar ABC transporter permease [Candidatus Ochrobactrum gambitense]